MRGWTALPEVTLKLVPNAEPIPEGTWIHPDGSLTADQDTVVALPEIFAEVDKMVSR